MDTIGRKKVSVIGKYAVENFTQGDWYSLGQLTGQLSIITSHPRLLRALDFSDTDYDVCAVEVLNTIFGKSPALMDEVIDHFDIDLWYKQKDPEKYQKLFFGPKAQTPDFWDIGMLRLFVSHLSKNKERMSQLKASLSQLGISAFIAHEDIEPTREWRNEVETALETMEVMAVVVEPGFKESDWCAQEVGYALGRHIEIIPLRAGMDPFGFFGKYQGINIKGKTPSLVSQEIVHTLLKKPKHRDQVFQSIGRAFTSLSSQVKLPSFRTLDTWSVASDDQMRSLLEQASLSEFEKSQLQDIIKRVGAFKKPPQFVDFAEDVPF